MVSPIIYYYLHAWIPDFLCVAVLFLFSWMSFVHFIRVCTLWDNSRTTAIYVRVMNIIRTLFLQPPSNLNMFLWVTFISFEVFTLIFSDDFLLKVSLFCLSAVPLPSMESDEMYIRAEAHNHGNYLNRMTSLR